jgi:hypothetical protein
MERLTTYAPPSSALAHTRRAYRYSLWAMGAGKRERAYMKADWPMVRASSSSSPIRACGVKGMYEEAYLMSSEVLLASLIMSL